MRLDHLLSMENMRSYHERLVFKIVLETERGTADTKQRAELVVVQFSVTERSVVFI